MGQDLLRGIHEFVRVRSAVGDKKRGEIICSERNMRNSEREKEGDGGQAS
jgi:hypothetical protein